MEKALLLTACLFRSLAHHFRNDLAVLKNELTYLKTLTAEGECDRAIDIIRDLSESLKLSELVSSGKLDCKDHSLSEVTAQLHDTGLVKVQRSEMGQQLINCDLARLSASIKALNELFASLVKTTLNEGPIFCALVEGERLYLHFVKPVRRMPEWIESELRVDSFSEFVLHAVKIDSVWAALSDAILWAHNAVSEIILGVSGDLTVTVKLPLKK